jgi:FkbM family methyltransferase
VCAQPEAGIVGGNLLQRTSQFIPKASDALTHIAHYDHPRWLHKCRQIYLDVGSNIGVQVRKLFEAEKYPSAPVLPLFDKHFGAAAERSLPGDETGLCALGLEPSPGLQNHLQELASAYQKRGWHVHFYPYAAFTEEDELSFEARDGVGKETASHLTERNDLGLPKDYGTGHGVTKVRAIDLAHFIDSLPQSSVRLMKIDIEGAEFKVVPHLAQAGLLCKSSIPEAFLEVHPRTNSSKAEGQQVIAEFLSHARNAEGSCEHTKLNMLDDESYAKDVDQNFAASYKVAKGKELIQLSPNDGHSYMFGVAKGKELIQLSPNDGHSYMFGYFDKRQVDDKNEKVIACQIPFFEQEPELDSKMIVGYVPFDGSGNFTAVGETTAWNLQQGSMAEWAGPSTIMFNTRASDGSGFKARSVNIVSMEVTTYPHPVYAISRDHGFFVGLNFSRLHLLRRGYGYTVPLQAPHDKCPDDDGIWKVDLATKTPEFLVSIKAVRDHIMSTGSTDPFTSQTYVTDAVSHRDDYWWINHAHISADGTKIAFLVRANPKALTETYTFSTLMVLDVSSKEIWRVPRVMGSHHYFGRMLLLSCDPAGTFAIHWRKPVEQLPWQKGVDGHCSVSPSASPLGEQWILTDTYPDKDGMKQLMVEELHGNRKYHLGSYKARETGPTQARCDLHPRWDTTGRYVLFDSTHAISRGQTLRGIYRVNAFPNQPEHQEQ